MVSVMSNRTPPRRRRSSRPKADAGLPRVPVGAFTPVDAGRLTVVATDGACRKNPGPGGWGWWVNSEFFGSGFEPATTNNQMEYRAVIEALRSVPGPVLIESDSSLLIDSMCGWVQGWMKNDWKTKTGPVKNRDLIEECLELVARREVLFRWVRGHNGHAGNEHADRLAVAAIDQHLPR